MLGASHIIQDHISTVIDTLTDLGFVINLEKSSLIPEHSKTYLGFVVDCLPVSGKPEIWVTPARARKLRQSIVRLCSRPTCTAREFSRVLGQGISMSLTVTFGKVMLRNAYTLL